MTRDEIVQIAWDVGLLMRSHQSQDEPTKLERFAERIAAAEREACADICERRKSLYWMEFDKTGSDAERSAAIASEECATAICARGESK